MNDAQLQQTNQMAADAGNDVIMAAERRPETEVDNESKRHVVRVSHWRPSFHHHLLSTLLLLLTLMTAQSLALSGKYVNKQSLYSVCFCFFLFV